MGVGQKWIPLESNPEVFNKWAKEAGLTGEEYVFQDIYGLDEELLAMVGTPVKAVILLFPDGEKVKQKRREEDEIIAELGQPKLDSTIFWMKQTISNACGTMALIHVLANTDVTLSPMKPLQKFLDQCRDKSPAERAQLLETTTLFSNIHDQLAHGGQSGVPSNLDTDLHFVCFVEAPDAELRDETECDGVSEEGDDTVSPSGEETTTRMRLIELDGTRGGPVDRGKSENFLKSVAQVVKDFYIQDSSTMMFSMIALGGPPPFD